MMARGECGVGATTTQGKPEHQSLVVGVGSEKGYREGLAHKNSALSLQSAVQV